MANIPYKLIKKLYDKVSKTYITKNSLKKYTHDSDGIIHPGDYPDLPEEIRLRISKDFVDNLELLFDMCKESKEEDSISINVVEFMGLLRLSLYTLKLQHSEYKIKKIIGAK